MPSDPSINYIKRVVGLPGDIVNYQPVTKTLTINGDEVPFELLGPYQREPGYEVGRERLGDGTHLLLHRPGKRSLGGTYVVPDDHYFVMGDNRDNSQDSRYADVRYVPEGLLVGRAVRIWMSWRGLSEGGARWGRIGKGIE